MLSHQTMTNVFNHRLLRLSVWALLMCGELLLTARYSLGKTIWIPMVFLPLMVPMVFLPLSKTEYTEGQTRFLRFALWASLMFVAYVVTMDINQRKLIFIPIVFLPLMVPMVLMPFKKTGKTAEPA